jgi:DNA-binding PadR family transcriptional regulator
MQRITYSAACVLHALSKGEAYGFDIMERTGLPSGTVYPMLRRFEHVGLVSSGWETPEEAFADRRPQRRNYQLTDEGFRALARAAERYRKQLEVFDVADPETRPAR